MHKNLNDQKLYSGSKCYVTLFTIVADSCRINFVNKALLKASLKIVHLISVISLAN